MRRKQRQGAAPQARHIAHYEATLNDSAQWALASTSLLYLPWVRLTAPAGLSD